MADTTQGATAGSSRLRIVELFREVALTGVAVVVPAVISAYVLVVVFNAIRQLLQPIAAYVFPQSETVGTVLALLTLAGVILIVGFVAHFRTGMRAIHVVDAAIGRIPGVGTIYRSFRRMSDVMLESDADHFQDVKLIAFPHDHSYTIAFVTAPTPPELVEPTGEGEMVTLFVPMSPNPVMGGFVVNVPRDRVYDVDMSVEDGIRAIVTSGVTLDGRIEDADSFSAPVWELPDVSDIRGLGAGEIHHLDVEELRELETRIEERLLEETSDGEDREEDR